MSRQNVADRCRIIQQESFKHLSIGQQTLLLVDRQMLEALLLNDPATVSNVLSATGLYQRGALGRELARTSGRSPSSQVWLCSGRLHIGRGGHRRGQCGPLRTVRSIGENKAKICSMPTDAWGSVRH